MQAGRLRRSDHRFHYCPDQKYTIETEIMVSSMFHKNRLDCQHKIQAGSAIAAIPASANDF
jgi:hypothetical protein